MFITLCYVVAQMYQGKFMVSSISLQSWSIKVMNKRYSKT